MRKEVVGLGGGQHAGGFVENENVGAAIERLRISTRLLHADAEVLDQRVGIDGELVFAGQSLELAAGAGEGRGGGGGGREEATPNPLAPSTTFSSTVKLLHQLENAGRPWPMPAAIGGLAVGDLGSRCR